MADSEVELVNLALVSLGESTITALAEDAERARNLTVIYASMRDAVLAAHVWNEAVKRAAPAALTTTPIWGFTYEYQLPADFLRFISMNDQSIDFRLEAGKLLTNSTSPEFMYTYRLTEVVRMTPLLQQAISARIAAELTMRVRGSEEQYERYYQLYLDKVSEARYMDSQQSPSEQYGGDTWTGARLSYDDLTFRPIPTP